MRRYRIFHTRESISSSESKQLADFNRLLKTYQEASKTSSKKGKWIGLFAIILGLGVGTLFFLHYPTGKIKKDVPGNFNNSTSEMDTISDDQLMENIGSVEEKISPEPDLLEGDSPEVAVVYGEKESSESTSPPKTVTSSFTSAKPVHGFPHLYQYFEENLVYPDSLVSEKIQGKVIVRFTINSKGNPVDILVEIPLHPRLDSLATKLVMDMPEWYPAFLNGKPISSTHRIPLFFRIEDED